MSDPSALFMRFFVELVHEASRRKRLKNGDFASLVWSELTERSARQRWQYIRKGIPGKGRPIAVTLDEAYKMARVLGQDPLVLFLRAKDRVSRVLEEAENANEGRPGRYVRGRNRTESDN